MYKAIISGRLTRDAKVLKDYIALDIAQNFSVKGEEKTNFHRVMFKPGNLQKVSEIFVRGTSVLVEAFDMTASTYQKGDGTWATDITYWARAVEITGWAKNNSPTPNTDITADVTITPASNDLPF